MQKRSTHSKRKAWWVQRNYVQKGKRPPVLSVQPVAGASIAWPNHYTIQFRLDWGNNQQASYDKILEGARANAKDWRLWINSYTAVYGSRYAFTQLKNDWKLLRLSIGLQQRLQIEQIFSDMGEPYNQFVTGFGAMK